MCERAFPYPDNVTPLLIYRKSIRETPAKAYAKAGAKAESFIPKYGETFAFTLVANFAINIWTNFYEVMSMLGMHQCRRPTVYALHPHELVSSI